MSDCEGHIYRKDTKPFSLSVALISPRLAILQVFMGVFIYFLGAFTWPHSPLAMDPHFSPEWREWAETYCRSKQNDPPCTTMEQKVKESGPPPTFCNASSLTPPFFPVRTQLDYAPVGPGNHQVDARTNAWGVPMANSTVELSPGRRLSYDDILFGYDLMYEGLALFARVSWMGVPFQQDPQDAFMIAQLLYAEQPDLLIEIGTNSGGSALFYASVVSYYAPEEGLVLTIDPKDPSENWFNGDSVCSHCVEKAMCSRLWNSKHIEFIQGYSHDPLVLERVKDRAAGKKKVVVIHDGAHDYQSVLQDLHNYDPLTTIGSYMIVQDTKMTRQYMAANGNGYPLAAVRDFLEGEGRERYVIDKQYEALLYSQHHDGFIRKLRK